MGPWWILLVAYMVLFMVPVGYGWGYRGWGAPYPRYIQRRRGARAAAANNASTFNHHAWGLRGDFVWLMLAVALFWTVSRIWWR